MRKREGRGRPRANHFQGGNLRAAWRPLAAYFAAVRRALAPAAGPRTCCSRFFLIRSRRGHGTHAWAKNWDSNTVLCGTWQIPGANTRATVPSPRAVSRGKGERIKAVASALVAARSSAMSGGSKWTTGGLIAQWATAPPIEEAAIASLRWPDGSARVVETKIGWPFGRKCRGAAASQPKARNNSAPQTRRRTLSRDDVTLRHHGR